MESLRCCREQTSGAEAWIVDAFARIGGEKINHHLDNSSGRCKVPSEFRGLLGGLVQKSRKGISCFLLATGSVQIEYLGPLHECLDDIRRLVCEALNDGHQPLQGLAEVATRCTAQGGQDFSPKGANKPLTAKVAPRGPVLIPRQSRQVVVTVEGGYGSLFGV